MRSSLPSWLLPLALLLPVSTLAAPPEAVSGDFKPLTDDDGYVVALQAVAEATVTIGSDLERSYEQLEVALDSLMEYAPLIAVDPHAQRIQIKGQLSLARAALHLGERDAAVVVMDEVVSSLSLAGELDSFPIESVGPSIGALFRERRAHFEAGNS